MKRGNKQFDLKTIGVVTVGGAAIMIAAAQILAKPAVPVVGKVVSSTGHASTGALNTSGGGIVPGVRLALAGEPPVRELFRPLVSKETKDKPVKPTGPTPLLPNAGVKKPAATTKPTGGAPETVAVTGPKVSDIRMIGLVELGDTPKVLLKNISTGERRYFVKGDDAFGFKITEIRSNEVLFDDKGRTQRVPMETASSIEGQSFASTPTAPSSGFSGRSGGFSGGGGFSRGSGGGGGFSRDRGNGNDRGGGRTEASTAIKGLDTTAIFSLPTWAERLKKLEDSKSLMEADKYEKLHTFMLKKVEEDKAAKK